MLKSLKARSKQADSDLALMGHPNAFPSVPKASASDWTIMQSLRVATLRHTFALKSGKCKTWKLAVDQLTRDAEDMRVLVRNLKEQERRVSPTSHAPVLLMPSQKFLREVMEMENAFAPTGPFTMRAAQFIRIFVENGIYSESITEALDVYESFHVLEALPTRWSPIHLFKCNCRTCFTHASCAHVLLASMVCDHKIEIPVQYVSTTFQVRSKRGRPAVSGQNMEVGDVEEEARKKVHKEGYEVPSVTMLMETVDSDEDFEQPPPSQVAFTLHCIRDEDGLMVVLHRDRGRVRSELRRNGTRGASTLMVGARTRVGRELRRLNQRHAGRWVELCCE